MRKTTKSVLMVVAVIGFAIMATVAMVALIPGERPIDDVALMDDAELPCVQLWENGPYWAKCNVGATKPEEFGYYFWWGDTVGYKRQGGTWSDGRWYMGVTWVSSKGQAMSSSPFISSNCPTYNKINSQLRSAGYIDSTENLVAQYDAATAHLGAPWRMPTEVELRALISNCETTWTNRNGVYGQFVTGKGAYASKSIFLPTNGCGFDSFLDHPGMRGFYWTSTSCSFNSLSARDFYLNSDDVYDPTTNWREVGRAVRPVRASAK